jgi:hypothetical protein
MSEERYSQWSILELLGHRRLAGFVTEQEIAGKGFLRIDIPGERKVTQFYSPDSVYGLTPTTEEVARRVAANGMPAVARLPNRNYAAETTGPPRFLGEPSHACHALRPRESSCTRPLRRTRCCLPLT